MIVFSVPPKLKFAVLSLFLSVPLICFQVIIVTRSPWWNLPFTTLAYWGGAFFMICTPLYFWILSAKKWSYYLTLVLGIVWISSTCWLAIRMLYPNLGFFTIFLSFIIFLQYVWIKHEIQRSFFDPRLNWYQGFPQSISLLQCTIQIENQSFNLRISRIDEEGVFVFHPKSLPSDYEEIHLKLKQFGDRKKKKEKKKIPILLQFRDYKMTCLGKPILAIDRNFGLGIQFVEMTQDQKKEMSDFIEMLRGEGYVG